MAKSEAYETLHCISMLIGILAVAGLIFITLFALWSARKINAPLISLIDGLTSNSSQVASAARQVSSSSQSLAQGSTEQASSLEETAAALEQISSMAKHNTDNSQQADALTDSVKNISLEGANSMHEMSAAIEAIKKSADETTEIIKSIDDIAFQPQTNHKIFDFSADDNNWLNGGSSVSNSKSKSREASRIIPLDEFEM